MSDSETKQERLLKRTQLWVAVIAGCFTLIVGAYNVKNIFFSKKGPGGVAIEVRAENGKAVGRASVEIMKVQGGLVASAGTGFDGKYGKSGLDPGSYTLKVTKANFQPETLFFSVEPGRTTELNLKLKPASASIRSAVEEVGASWIKEIGLARTKSAEKTQTETQN